MKVYIEQLDCTGSGQCELMLPEVFVLRDDGFATVKTPAGEELPEGGVAAPADVLPEHEHRVRDVVDVCPGACIFIIEGSALSSPVPRAMVHAAHVLPTSFEPRSRTTSDSEPPSNH